MNFRLTAENLFPNCTFDGQIEGEGYIEILGLARAMTPQNCEVLASGEFQYSTRQPPHKTYLVKAHDHVLQVRVFSTFKVGICAHITHQRFGAPYGYGLGAA